MPRSKTAEPAFPKDGILSASLIAEIIAFVRANKDRPGGAELVIKLDRLVISRNKVARGT